MGGKLRPKVFYNKNLPPFKLTQKQNEALNLISSSPRQDPFYLLMFGGSQSAKTSFACYFMQVACLKYPDTTGLICRRNFTDLKATIFQNTFPSMLELRYRHGADVSDIATYDYSPPLCCHFYNGSKIYFIGLEDNSNFEKILGRKLSMFLIDEASEIGYQAFSKLTTRLSENSDARHVGFVTINPTSVFSWVYKLFVEKLNPIDDKPLKNFSFFNSIQMNPKDNLDNLPKGYIENLENLSEHERERFLHGNFATTTEGAVYELQLRQAHTEKRVTPLPKPDKHYPIYFAWDIGWDDYSTCWIYQILPQGIFFFRYLEANHIDILEFLSKTRRSFSLLLNGYWFKQTIGILPHDALHVNQQTGLTTKQVLVRHCSNFPLEPISWLVEPKPKAVFAGINAARILFQRCWFDTLGCDTGLRRLGSYKQYDTDGNEEFSQKTKHDIYSHAADSFRYALRNYTDSHFYREQYRNDPNQIYGSDLVSPHTRRQMGL